MKHIRELEESSLDQLLLLVLRQSHVRGRALELHGMMVERLGEVVSHEDLMASGWPDFPDPDPLWLKPHLARLREKLLAAGAQVPVAVRGVGYLLDA